MIPLIYLTTIWPSCRFLPIPALCSGRSAIATASWSSTGNDQSVFLTPSSWQRQCINKFMTCRNWRLLCTRHAVPHFHGQTYVGSIWIKILQTGWSGSQVPHAKKLPQDHAEFCYNTPPVFHSRATLFGRGRCWGGCRLLSCGVSSHATGNLWSICWWMASKTSKQSCKTPRNTEIHRGTQRYTEKIKNCWNTLLSIVYHMCMICVSYVYHVSIPKTAENCILRILLWPDVTSIYGFFSAFPAAVFFQGCSMVGSLCELHLAIAALRPSDIQWPSPDWKLMEVDGKMHSIVDDLVDSWTELRKVLFKMVFLSKKSLYSCLPRSSQPAQIIMGSSWDQVATVATRSQRASRSTTSDLCPSSWTVSTAVTAVGKTCA